MASFQRLYRNNVTNTSFVAHVPIAKAPEGAVNGGEARFRFIGKGVAGNTVQIAIVDYSRMLSPTPGNFGNISGMAPGPIRLVVQGTLGDLIPDTLNGTFAADERFVDSLTEISSIGSDWDILNPVNVTGNNATSQFAELIVFSNADIVVADPILVTGATEVNALG